MKKILLFIWLFALLIPISYSNGGCIKIADDMFVQFTSAPHVPVAGQQTSYLISFGNVKGPIYEKISGRATIVQNQKEIFAKDFKINDSILDFKYTFGKPGLYEIFLTFRINNKAYNPEDFLVEVKEKDAGYKNNVLFLIAGILIGIMLMKFKPDKRFKGKQ